MATGMVSAGKAMTLGLTLPIVAGAAFAVKAAMEEQQQMEVLANTLRENLPNATDETIAANEEWITSMQNATGVADGELRDAMRHLVLSGMDLETAQANLTIAMDIAAAKGLDLEAVTNAMAKANRGNVGALGRLGIATKDAEGNTLTFEQVMANAADTMGGAAAAAADTAAGRMAIMTARIADLTETIGMMLLPVVEKMVGWLSSATAMFQNLSPGMQKVIVILAGVAAAIGPVLFVGGKLILAFGAIKKAFIALKLVMMAHPWLLLIAAVVALVIIIVKNWDKIVAFLKRTWEWIKSAAAAVGNFLMDMFKKATDFVVYLFLNWTIYGRIVKHFDAIKEAVTAVKNWFVDRFNNVVDFMKSIPGRIGAALSGLWSIITGPFAGPIAWVEDRIQNLIDIWNRIKSLLAGTGTATGNTGPGGVVQPPSGVVNPGLSGLSSLGFGAAAAGVGGTVVINNPTIFGAMDLQSMVVTALDKAERGGRLSVAAERGRRLPPRGIGTLA